MKARANYIVSQCRRREIQALCLSLAFHAVFLGTGWVGSDRLPAPAEAPADAYAELKLIQTPDFGPPHVRHPRPVPASAQAADTHASSGTSPATASPASAWTAYLREIRALAGASLQRETSGIPAPASPRTARIRLHLNPGGGEAELAEGSGSALWDRAALKAVRGALKRHPLPTGLAPLPEAMVLPVTWTPER
ncbi:MAG: hypothetical protein IT285_06755 [Bdellovibrionales bacterium]|nr:hypothetical protein [Bdellovibrionales bacterium]